MVSGNALCMSGYVGDDLVGHTSGLVNISIEALIAELVDNSLDKNATKIHVDIMGTERSNLTFIVYDNSPVGFGTVDALDAAFRVAGKKTRAQDEIGSFHMGMKVSTTSKFHDVAAFTVIDSVIHHRRINFQHTMEEKYEPLSDVVFPRASEVKNALDSGEWRTAICLHDPPSVLFGKPGEISASSLTGFSRQVAMFFGITYQKTLQKNPELSMTINAERVVPLDPFWASFTPTKIRERLDIPVGQPGHIGSVRQREVLENTIPWATIATRAMELPVQYNGKEYNIKVQGFIIPWGNVRQKLHKQDLAEGVFVDKPTNAGTKTLNAQFLSGFFFYRNDRCIAFGKTGIDSNGGWYNYGEPGDNQSLGVRFKIEFPSDLDGYFRVSPTKSTVLPIEDFYQVIQTAWDQKIVEPKLRNKLGDGKRPFFQKTDVNKTVVGAATSSTNNKNVWVDDCEHCNGFHVKGTRCSYAPCSICDSKSTCKKDCEHVCKHCKAVGEHVEKNCPLNCKYCSKEGGHLSGEQCPSCCTKCAKPTDKCDCPCGTCGEPKLTGCECEANCSTCKLPENECECRQGESSGVPHSPDSVFYLELYRKNKDENIRYIREAMVFLGILKEDL